MVGKGNSRHGHTGRAKKEAWEKEIPANPVLSPRASPGTKGASFLPHSISCAADPCTGIRKPAGKAPSLLLRLEVGCPGLSPLPKDTLRATTVCQRPSGARRASLPCPKEEFRHGEPMPQPPNLQPYNDQTLRCGTALSGLAGTPSGHAAVRPPPASPPAPDKSSPVTLLEMVIPLGTVSVEPRFSGTVRTKRDVGGRRKAEPARYQILTITPHRHRGVSLQRTTAGERSVLQTHAFTFPFPAWRKQKLCERGVLKLG